MQLIQIVGLLAALMPLSAMASPVDVAEIEQSIFRRGKDICTHKRNVGATCNYGPGADQPHVCNKSDSRGVLHCVKGKWKPYNKCTVGQHCTCTSENDIVCKN